MIDPRERTFEEFEAAYLKPIYEAWQHGAERAANEFDLKLMKMSCPCKCHDKGYYASGWRVPQPCCACEKI